MVEETKTNIKPTKTPLTHEDFEIGTEFYTVGNSRWRCVDKGRDYIIALLIKSKVKKSYIDNTLFEEETVPFNQIWENRHLYTEHMVVFHRTEYNGCFPFKVYMKSTPLSLEQAQC